jgi:hypothetical protein
MLTALLLAGLHPLNLLRTILPALDAHLRDAHLLAFDMHLLRAELLALDALRRLHALHHLRPEFGPTAATAAIAAAMVAAAAAGCLLLRGATAVRITAATVGAAATARTTVRTSRGGRSNRERGNTGGEK